MGLQERATQRIDVTQDTAKPDPAIVLELILAFRRSKTMFAAVKLGVFDELETGPKSVASLATAMKLNRDALERLLDACVGLTLLKYRGLDEVYENTLAASTYLCKNSPSRLTGYINCSNDVFWKLWGNLEDAVREGTNRWKETFNLDGDFWSGFYKSEDAIREFLIGMHGYGQITSPHVVRAFDLSNSHMLVDLGGGTGHLAIAACEEYPNLQATVFDLPEALPLAREIIGASTVANRIKVVEGDFFKDRLPEGDVYVVARTLHDWPEDKVVALMKKVRQALPEAGRFLIAEKMLEDDKTGPEWAQMQNLNMLTCAEGKERTFEEYETMLTGAGFSVATCFYTSSPLDVILAHDNPRVVIQAAPVQLARSIEPPIPLREIRSMSFVELAQLYHAFFESTRLGCVLSELDGRFVLVNQAYANIHGRNIRQTLRLSYKEFTPDKYRVDDIKQIAELQQRGRVGPFDKEYFREDGTLVPVRVTLELIKVNDHPYIWSIVEEIGKAKLIQADPRVQ
jgi:acetylserotonin N-methyltransferase